jgi:hypothetical protein
MYSEEQMASMKQSDYQQRVIKADLLFVDFMRTKFGSAKPLVLELSDMFPLWSPSQPVPARAVLNGFIFEIAHSWLRSTPFQLAGGVRLNVNGEIPVIPDDLSEVIWAYGEPLRTWEPSYVVSASAHWWTRYGRITDDEPGTEEAVD